MPHADAYTYVPPDGYGAPYVYVYHPAQGWSWVVAPWIWGWGPWPYFGTYGPSRFAWYGHGWWRYPRRWHLAPQPFGGFGYHGVRPVPPRVGVGYGTGFGGRGGAVFRGGAAGRGGFGGHGGSGGRR